MKKTVFERELLKADSFKSTNNKYWSGYIRGLRRRYHGADFGEPGDHEKWIGFTRDPRGDGYRAGYRGPVDWQDLPQTVKIIRTWRGWSTDELGERLARSGRTIENWEQGRRQVPEAAAAALKRIWAET